MADKSGESNKTGLLYRAAAVLGGLAALLAAIPPVRDSWQKLFPPEPEFAEVWDNTSFAAPPEDNNTSVATDALDGEATVAQSDNVAVVDAGTNDSAAETAPRIDTTDDSPEGNGLPPGVTPGQSLTRFEEDGPLKGMMVERSFGPAMPGFASPPIGNWWCIIKPGQLPNATGIQACPTLRREGDCSCQPPPGLEAPVVSGDVFTGRNLPAAQ
jgi:hypothetical protein